MATWFRALSNIEHGVEKVLENGDIQNMLMKFPFGAKVEGIEKDAMKLLWDAGVLEKVEDVEPPAPEITTTVTSTPPASQPVEGVSTPPAPTPDEGSGEPQTQPPAETQPPAA